MKNNFNKKIFICATEQSGDNIGAKIIKQLNYKKNNYIFEGVGGNKMENTWSAMGADTLYPNLFDDGDLKTGNWLHFVVTYADRESTSEGGVARKTYLNGELIQEANLNWSTTGGSMDDGMYFGITGSNFDDKKSLSAG